MEVRREVIGEMASDVASAARRVPAAVAGEVTSELEEHRHGEERPIIGYAMLLATYGTATAGLGYLARRRRRPLPERPDIRDLVLISVATHKVSRMLAKDSVLAVVRAPFTRYEEPAGAGEVNEEVRGSGPRHAVGELVTCPFCLAQWVGTAFMFGLVFAPRATRMAAGLFCTVAASDALQFAYAALEHTAES
jgi:hypothetical protein